MFTLDSFRTRSGDVVRLVELLDEAKSRCAATIKERWTEQGGQVRRLWAEGNAGRAGSWEA